MASLRHRQRNLPFVILCFLLLTPSPPGASALGLGLGFSQYRTFLSLSGSLLARVANARSARGDLSGAARIRRLASNLRFLTGNAGIFSLGWDYVWNYYSAPLELPLADMARLARKVSEASRAGSRDRIAVWIAENYSDLRELSLSVIRGLLRSFSRSGAIRDAVLALKKEIEEGDLLKDCLEVGTGDLEGLVRIAKDLFFSYSQSASARDTEL